MMLAALVVLLPVMALATEAENPAEEDASSELEEAMEPDDDEEYEEPVDIEYEEDDEEEDSEEPEEAVNEAPSPFVGEWQCENTIIFIDRDEGAFSVYILRDAGDGWNDVWEYTCVPDDEAGTLTGEGKRSRVVYGEEGEPVSSEEIYHDGSAVFTLEDDVLIWADAKEDIAKDMRFERNEEGPVAEADEELTDEEETEESAE
jgi:hypothetical protein